MDLVKALLLENIHPDAVARLEAEGIAVETSGRALDEDELIERIDGVTLLGIRSKTRVTARVSARPRRGSLAVGAFCIGTDQIDLAAAAGRGDRGVQRAVLQHPQRGRAGPGRDHRADPAADREERGDARRGVGQGRRGQPRGTRPDAGHRRVRQHRHPAVGARREPGHDGVDFYDTADKLGAGQRAALRHAWTSCSMSPTW